MLTQEDKLLLIGQVTALSNVPIRTIRYYESLGLIQSGDRTEGAGQPARRAAGRRRHRLCPRTADGAACAPPAAALALLRLIVVARSLVPRLSNAA